jgi:hypothetical protein
MLHTVIFISGSGIVLFVKEFIDSSLKVKRQLTNNSTKRCSETHLFCFLSSFQPGQLGGILTAMLKFSIQRTGLPVSYIELESTGVAICGSDRLTCVVFHDSSDGAEFGRLMAQELLFSFTNSYSSELQDSKVNSPDLFSEFNGKIASIIRNSTRPVIDALADQKGISLVLLTTSDHIVHSTSEVDNLAVLANHQALLNVATDLMAAQNDVPLSLTLKARKTTLFVQRIERATLVVVYKNSVDIAALQKEIDKTAHLLRKVLVMASNLKT